MVYYIYIIYIFKNAIPQQVLCQHILRMCYLIQMITINVIIIICICSYFINKNNARQTFDRMKVLHIRPVTIWTPRQYVVGAFTNESHYASRSGFLLFYGYYLFIPHFSYCVPLTALIFTSATS